MSIQDDLIFESFNKEATAGLYAGKEYYFL